MDRLTSHPLEVAGFQIDRFIFNIPTQHKALFGPGILLLAEAAKSEYASSSRDR